MSTFDDREKAFEAKFAHDAELLFKAETRRDHYLGLWAAEILGKSEAEAEAYATKLLREDFKQPGDEDVFAMLRADIGHLIDDLTLRAKMDELFARAKAEVAQQS